MFEEDFPQDVPHNLRQIILYKKTSSLPSLYGDWMFFIIRNCKDTEALLISHCQWCSASSISSINISRKLMRSRMLDTQMDLSP